ncbi:MAG: pantetheine-phosphate adenylyltransferase [Candidatus Levybacteria bacterium]|nr:pantetheine-phosphate adenylyltransferase [Candidatus Levybacteria bacterium]
MKYDLIASGGTFDLLHKGHKSFLNQVVKLADKVIVGVTSDSYVSSFKINNYEDFKTRERNVYEYLKTLSAPNKIEIVEINDIYGPVLSKKFKAGAMAVTPQTNRTAIGINEKRLEMGLSKLSIEVIEMDAADDGGFISSTRIRNGEINREGRLYVNKRWLSRDLQLPEILRSSLHKPLGKILSDVPREIDSNIITIGDITTKKFNEKNINQFLSIIDFQVKRQKKFDGISDLGFKEIKAIKIKNPAGTISSDLFKAIIDAIKSKKRQIILVDGEEDLAVLPVIIASPLGFQIYYGQPDEGLVEVEVTEKVKEKIYDILSKFTG